MNITDPLVFDSEETFQFKSIAKRTATGYFFHAEKTSTGIEHWIKVNYKKQLLSRYESLFTEGNEYAEVLLCMERNILEMLQPHPFLPTLSYAMQTTKHTLLVTDALPGDTLHDLLHLRPESSLKEGVVQFYMAELLLAVQHVHARGIVHRNVSLNSCFITQAGHLQLMDFGNALKVDLQETLFKKQIQIPLLTVKASHLPPEYDDGRCINYSGDLWAVGACFFELLTGNKLIISNFLSGGNEESIQKLSMTAHDLLQQMLHDEPAARPSLEEIKSHAFFTGIQWEDALLTKNPLNSSLFDATPYRPDPKRFAFAKSYTFSHMCDIMALEKRVPLVSSSSFSFFSSSVFDRNISESESYFPTWEYISIGMTRLENQIILQRRANMNPIPLLGKIPKASSFDKLKSYVARQRSSIKRERSKTLKTHPVLNLHQLKTDTSK